jgi:UDP-N-acetylglucosamine diphosphorylase/glucosamine-1-phosphate N-acetyltransferase
MIVLIMAGGLGKRMESHLPKVLHKVNNYPMIVNVIKTAILLNPEKIYIIVGKYKDIIDSTILEYLSENDYLKIDYVIQEEALGTGHAINCSLNKISNYNDNKCIILSGDVPLISQETLQYLIDGNDDKMLITELENPSACGRIIFNDNKVIQIIEEKECSDEEKEIKYVNCGIYQISVINLLKYIPLINNNNKANEYYLTDIVDLMNSNNNNIGYYILPQDKQYEIKNVNTKHDLINLNHFIENNNII